MKARTLIILVSAVSAAALAAGIGVVLASGQTSPSGPTAARGYLAQVFHELKSSTLPPAKPAVGGTQDRTEVRLHLSDYGESVKAGASWSVDEMPSAVIESVSRLSLHDEVSHECYGQACRVALAPDERRVGPTEVLLRADKSGAGLTTVTVTGIATWRHATPVSLDNVRTVAVTVLAEHSQRALYGPQRIAKPEAVRLVVGVFAEMKAAPKGSSSSSSGCFQGRPDPRVRVIFSNAAGGTVGEVSYLRRECGPVDVKRVASKPRLVVGRSAAPASFITDVLDDALGRRLPGTVGGS